MPNWCSNCFIIEDIGDQTLYDTFKNQMEEWENDYNEGHSPLKKVEDSYLFNVADNGSDIWTFETKWSPNIKSMVAIANMYKFSFHCSFEEFGNCIYGEYKYNHKTKELHTNEVELQQIIDIINSNTDKDDDEDSDTMYEELDAILEKQPYKLEENEN